MQEFILPGALLALLIWREIANGMERKVLLDRLMARDLTEYRQARGDPPKSRSPLAKHDPLARPEGGE